MPRPLDRFVHDLSMITEKRREEARYEIADLRSVEIFVQRDSDETVQGELHNLSASGVQLLLPVYPKFAEELELRIHVPDAQVTIEAAAEVVWIRPAEDNQCLIGCSFTKALSETALDSLAKARISNRRRHPRREVSLAAIARWELDADSFPAQIIDYSEGGFCMASGRPTTVGETVSVELDAPGDVIPPIFGKVCWQKERDGEYIIGCSLRRGDDFEYLRRLGDVSGDERRTKPSSLAGGKTGSKLFPVATWVFAFFVSTVLGYLAIESWRSPSTKVRLADAERDAVALAVSSDTDSAMAGPSHRVDHREPSTSSDTDSATTGPSPRVDHREPSTLAGKTDQIVSDAFGIGHHATQETTLPKSTFAPPTIGDTGGIQLGGDEVLSKSTDTIMEPAIGTDDEVLAPESAPRLKSTSPSANNVNSSVSVPHVERSDAPARVGQDDSSGILFDGSVGVDRIPRQIPTPTRVRENQDTSVKTDVTTKLTPRVKNTDHNNSVTPSPLAPRVNVTKAKEAIVVGEEDSEAEREAVAALKKLGAQIEGGHSVTLANNTKITDADLAHLKEMNSLRKLFLNGTKVTNSGLEHLQGLASLRALRLGNTEIGDAGLVHIKGLTDLSILWLNDTQVSDAGLAHLQGLTKLQWLGLSPNITDAGLKHLKGLTRLKGLFLNDTKVTGSGLEHLDGLTDLMRLYLNNSKVTDAGLEPLQRLPGLEDLRIQQTSVTDKGLDHLKGLTNLKLLFLPAKTTDAGLEHLKNMTAMTNLGLKGTQVTGPGLRHIKGMTNLKWLWLNGTQVSDDSLVHLKELNTLAILRLEGTDITDAGLVHLQAMKTLKELYLQNTKVSRKGIDKLKAALPHCTIK